MRALAASAAVLTAAITAGCAAATTAIPAADPPPPIHMMSVNQALRAAAGPVRLITVRNLHGGGPGSLRAAITAANSRPRRKVAIIGFAVHGIIRLGRALPAITSPVVIDGGSSPAYRGSNAPVVEIDCLRHAGLRFAAGSRGSQLLGVAVDDARGAGVTLAAGPVIIDDDYIGLNLAGAAYGNHGDGIDVAATSAGNQIGYNPGGTSGLVTNVISGNSGSGIAFAGSSRNTVVSNHIGTNLAGTAAIPNGGDGLRLARGSDRNEIGGTDYTDPATGEQNNPTGSEGTVPPVFVVPPLGNLISGNGGAGVVIGGGSFGNALNGNFIGTTADGDGRLGNKGDGVWIDHANGNALTGCKFVNNPFAYYNVLSGNGGDGLLVTDSDRTKVQGNFFGIGADNATVLGNRLDGVKVAGDSADTQVGGVIPLGNVSSGNGMNGIAVAGTARGFTTFNTFGGLLAFKGAAPNGGDGLLITSTGGDNLARTNVFSGNRRNGIELAGDASGVTIDPDIAGLTTKGDAPLPNGGDGVLIDGNAHGNVVGGTRRSVIPQDTFSGNKGYGLAITGTAHANRVLRSYIGTLIFGAQPAGNGRGGVLVGGSAYRNTIGLVRLRPANLVSGNAGNGITLLARTRGNRILNNYIGLNRLGHCVPNSGQALVNAGGGNLISGNRFCGSR